MNQENESRFSHVTVGRPGGAVSSHGDDEEVITIGAVDTVPASASAPAVVPAVAPALTPALAADEDAAQHISPDAPAALGGDGVVDDTGLDAPMSIAQKLVIAVCLVALAITVAFLVWFWMTQR
ncbi:MAG: hypothetical protein LBP24_01135 [Coriobacteriales bacterium]|nr:hypothetical protein [Coriobacteriales bacterium]